MCKEVTCGYEGEFQHGQRTVMSGGKDIKIGDKVSFKCDEGFTLDGADIVECQDDGSFSESQPICQPVPCSLPPM